MTIKSAPKHSKASKATPKKSGLQAVKKANSDDLPPRTSPPSKLDLGPLTCPGKLYQA